MKAIALRVLLTGVALLAANQPATVCAETGAESDETPLLHAANHFKALAKTG
jgi:hypothetical protein